MLFLSFNSGIGTRILFLFALAIVANESIAQTRTSFQLEHASTFPQADQIEDAAERIITEINNAFVTKHPPEFADSLVTGEGTSYINALWKTAPFYCPETSITTSLVYRSHDNRFEVRGVRLLIKAGTSNPHEEEGILVFNAEGQLDQLLFGVKKQLYQYVIDTNAKGEEYVHRQIILDFVEKFRTAYNLKDLPFIRNVLSENALIIVGNVVETNSSYELTSVLEDKTVRLVRYSKEEYLGNLQKVFERNEFIDVGYDSLEVYQHPQYPEIYGVTMLQYWNSSTYSDRGYLFLMIDFRERNRPIIHVRTWQLAKFTAKEEVIGLGDFPIF